jgi:predicted site-specific integrase-resolvase
VKAVDGPELLTPYEAARLLGITVDLLNRRYQAGLVERVLVFGGTRTRYPRAEITRLLNNPPPRRRS